MSGNGSLPRGAAGQLITGSIQEHLFILGLLFSYEDYTSYGASEEKIIIFDPRECSCAQVTFDPLVFYAPAGPITIDIYTEVSYTLGTGTLLVQSNRRETSPNASEMILRIGSAATLGFSGTKFAGDIVPSTGVSAPTGSGNANVGEIPFEIDLTKVKALGITNTNGAGVLVETKLTWAEIPAGF